jgi:Tol biopolymer transport system component
MQVAEGLPVTTKKSRWALWAGLAVVILIIVGGGAAWFYFSRSSRVAQQEMNVLPFTSSPGQKFDPVFSPDGSELAYTWKGERDDNYDIYVKLIGAGAPLRLTTSPAREYCPAWSPDGRYIAFIRGTPAGGSAHYVIPSLGGAERKIAEALIEDYPLGRCGRWSDDGKSLIVVDRASSRDAQPSIVMLGVEDGQRKALSPQNPYLAFPTPSPDRKMVAYAAGAGFLAADIHVLPATGGQPRRLTSDGRFLNGLAWTGDSEDIVFSSNRGGLFRLWRIPASGGTPERLSGVGEDGSAPAISRKGDRLAYVHSRSDSNIWRTAGANWKGRRPAAVKLAASSRWDIDGVFSPDSRRIAFASDRSGTFEIWTSNSDGTNQMQLTSLAGSDLGTPKWSPDAKTIAFDARAAGHGDIFVISAEGGSPRRLTTEPFENNVPSWSRDGKWIYFSSNRTGAWQIWKAPTEGGSAVQITKTGGFSAQESVDGKWLYLWAEPGTIWKMPVEGGEPVRVLQGVENFASWKLAANGIYFVDVSTSPALIKFMDLANQRTKPVTSVDFGYRVPGPPSFDVSQDGQWILFTRVDHVDSDIMLVENFR